MTEPTDGQIRARLGLVALLDRAWSALGAAEGALRQLAGEPADEPPAPG